MTCTPIASFKTDAFGSIAIFRNVNLAEYLGSLIAFFGNSAVRTYSSFFYSDPHTCITNAKYPDNYRAYINTPSSFFYPDPHTCINNAKYPANYRAYLCLSAVDDIGCEI